MHNQKKKVILTPSISSDSDSDLDFNPSSVGNMDAIMKENVKKRREMKTIKPVQSQGQDHFTFEAQYQKTISQGIEYQLREEIEARKLVHREDLEELIITKQKLAEAENKNRALADELMKLKLHKTDQGVVGQKLADFGINHRTLKDESKEFKAYKTGQPSNEEKQKVAAFEHQMCVLEEKIRDLNLLQQANQTHSLDSKQQLQAAREEVRYQAYKVLKDERFRLAIQINNTTEPTMRNLEEMFEWQKEKKDLQSKSYDLHCALEAFANKGSAASHRFEDEIKVLKSQLASHQSGVAAFNR